jgi:hypothetical protein
MVDAGSRMQSNLVRLSTRGRRIVAKESSHYIMLERPDAETLNASIVTRPAVLCKSETP